MSWADGRMLAFDTETTGVDVESDRIVSACVAWVGADDEPVVRRWLVAVDVDIPPAATDVHGISTEQARADGVPAVAAVAEILGEFEAAAAQQVPVVVFNAPFDLTLLDREARRWLGHPLPFTPRPVIDPLCIDKALDRYRKGKRTLAALSEHYQCRLEEAHSADGDALAAARLAWRLSRVFPGLADVHALHDAQVGWYRELSLSFAEYLRKCAAKCTDDSERAGLLLRADTVALDWPVRPLAGEVAA